MPRFRDDNDSGQRQQKYLTETVMQLYPIYLSIIQMHDSAQLAVNNKQSIVILKDVIGNVEWYKWKSNVQGSTNVKTCNGINPADCVLKADCQELVESVDHHWVPSVFLFSTFLEGILTGRVDTDTFLYFPQYVFMRMDSKDQKKLSRKILEKTQGRFEYIEQVLHPNQEDVVDLQDDDMEVNIRSDDRKPAAKKQLRRSDAEEKKEDQTSPMLPRRQSVRIAQSSSKKTTNENPSSSTSPGGIASVSTRNNGTASSVSTPIASNSGSKATTSSSNSPKTGSKTSKTRSKTAVTSTNNSNTTPQPRRKPKTKTQIFVKYIEDFMRDKNALIQNKGKVIEVLLRGAALIENEDKEEAEDNFLKNLQLNRNVIRRMLNLDKQLRREITEIVDADQAVESSNESSTPKTSKEDDGDDDDEETEVDDKENEEENEDEDDMEAKTTNDDPDFDSDSDSDDSDDDSCDNVLELKRKAETKKSASDAKRRRTK
jgi:hypothetical protein